MNNRVSEYASSASRTGRSKPVLRDMAYRNFMDHLMSGQLKPGLLVSQRELCEATGSSIGAMREALKRLEAEGVITLIPQRGVIVREPSEKEINDVYEARMIFEPHAVRHYAINGDLDKLAAIKTKTLQILDGKPETRAQLAELARQRSLVDDLLHQTIIDGFGNLMINEVFDKFRICVQVSRLGLHPRIMDNLPGMREHLIIIEALQKRDGDAAASAMIDHLEKGRRRAVGLE